MSRSTRIFGCSHLDAEGRSRRPGDPVYRPCEGKSRPLTAVRQEKTMMEGDFLLFDSAWLCLKAFRLIAEDRSGSLKVRDVRAW